MTEIVKLKSRVKDEVGHRKREMWIEKGKTKEDLGVRLAE